MELVEALRAGIWSYRITYFLFWAGIQTNEAEVQQLASSMDVDHDGDIEWDEFEIFYKKFSSDIFAKGIEPQEIEKIFIEYDHDFSGYLIEDEVLQVIISTEKFTLAYIIEYQRVFQILE